MYIKRLFFTLIVMATSIILTFLLLDEKTRDDSARCSTGSGDVNCGRSISRIVSSSSENLTLVSISKSKKMSKLVQETYEEDTQKVKLTTEKSQKIETANVDAINANADTESSRKIETANVDTINMNVASEMNQNTETKADTINANTDTENSQKIETAKVDIINANGAAENSQKIETAKVDAINVNAHTESCQKIETANVDTINTNAASKINQNIETINANADTESSQNTETAKFDINANANTENTQNMFPYKATIYKGNKRRYLIYQCDGETYCGGWGDRQRGIVSVFILSIVTNRTFGIRMSSPCDLQRFYIPNEVNWFIETQGLEGLTSIFVDGMGRNRKMFKLPTWDFNEEFPQAVVYLQTNINYVYALNRNPSLSKNLPQWARTRTGQNNFFKTAWNMLMKYSAHFEEHLVKMMTYASHKNLICAHVRLRQNPTIPNDGKTINSISTVSRLWEFLDKYVTNNSRVFIATDSQEVRNMSKEHFKGRQFDSGGFIIHIDRQGKWKEACEGFEIALLDQAILSQCKVLVCSESNFSMRAAMLSEEQELFVFRNGTITKLLQVLDEDPYSLDTIQYQ